MEAVETIGVSPTPFKELPKEEGKKLLNFFEALKAVQAGKKIHKLEWEDTGYFGLLDGSQLRLHKPDGKLYVWDISDGDMAGEDWVVL